MAEMQFKAKGKEMGGAAQREWPRTNPKAKDHRVGGRRPPRR